MCQVRRSRFCSRQLDLVALNVQGQLARIDTGDFGEHRLCPRDRWQSDSRVAAARWPGALDQRGQRFTPGREDAVRLNFSDGKLARTTGLENMQ